MTYFARLTTRLVLVSGLLVPSAASATAAIVEELGGGFGTVGVGGTTDFFSFDPSAGRDVFRVIDLTPDPDDEQETAHAEVTRTIIEELFFAPDGRQGHRYTLIGAFNISADGASPGANSAGVSTGSAIGLELPSDHDFYFVLDAELILAQTGTASTSIGLFFDAGDGTVINETLGTTGKKTVRKKATRKKSATKKMFLDIGGGGFVQNGSLSSAEANFQAILEILPVPLPAALPLLAAGLLGLIACRRNTHSPS